MILMSYSKSFKESLLNSSENLLRDLDKGKKLFDFKNPVIAHDTRNDPCLNYANSAALMLWGKCWNEMIGMPSRLTAPKESQKERQEALYQASKANAIKNYQGIRVNSQGELFIIKNARIWTILDEANNIVGQAATFNCWWKI